MKPRSAIGQHHEHHRRGQIYLGVGDDSGSCILLEAFGHTVFVHPRNTAYPASVMICGWLNNKPWSLPTVPCDSATAALDLARAVGIRPLTREVRS